MEDLHAPIETIENGKLTRRTFIKGVGWITVISAASAGLGRVGQALADAAGEPASDEALSDDSAGDQGETTYSYACCSYNCTSRCLLKGHVRDGKLVAVEPGEIPDVPTMPTPACAAWPTSSASRTRTCASCIP